ncbi:MAG: Rieske (2Fe-2S) protein [Prolixibacteraceae bacterium]
MRKPQVVSRKIFLRVLAGLITGLFLWIWYRIDKFQFKKDSQLEFRHNDDISIGLSYFGKYYLFRDEKSIKAFSTTCTHAGCRIGKTNSSVLQCGCHGSQFEASSGIPLRGPAYKPLQKLDCQFDSKSGQWIVRI